MTLLALDTGTTMGHAIKDAKIISGIKEFRKSKNDEIGKIYTRFEYWLDVVLKTFPDLEAVYYEKVIHHGGVRGNQSRAAQRYGGYEAILTAWCFKNNIPCHPIMWNSIKKFITGNGRASKDEVMEAVKKLGHNPINFDEADALALIHLAIDKTGTLI